MGSARLPLILLAMGCLLILLRQSNFRRAQDRSPLVTTTSSQTPALAEAEFRKHNTTEKRKELGDTSRTLQFLSRCRADQLVYVYDLPPQFNTGLIDDDCEKGWWAHPRNACVVYSQEHWGIGPPLSDEAFSALGSDPQLWADTGQHALEVMFHQYLKEFYPCRTLDPEAAAAFYVPVYAGRLWHVHSSYECREGRDCPEPPTLLRLETELDAHLERLPYIGRKGGRDHFITMAFSTYFGILNSTCCTSGLLNSRSTKAMTIMGTQQIYGHEDRQVNIPYPTAFHPVSSADIQSHQALIASSDRPQFVSFAGSLDRKGGLNAGREVRAALKEQCAAQPGVCKILNCAKLECSIAENIELYLKSTFCLQPPGDSPTRRGVFDAIQAGCIPVLFMPDTVSPYVEFLPELDQYAVMIPDDDVVHRGVNVLELLRQVWNSEIVAKRECMARILPRLVYRNVERTLRSQTVLASTDNKAELISDWTGAYEVAIETALRKMQSRSHLGTQALR